jgi:hypothetical protein
MYKVGDSVPLPGPVADIYRAVAELSAAYPRRPFTPDGHLVGSIGEVIAKKAFGDGFELTTPSTRGHDAVCTVRGNVQIKITAGKSIALNGPCDHLVVFQIISPERAKLVFDGPSEGLWESRSGKPNKQRKVSLKQLEEWAMKHQVL